MQRNRFSLPPTPTRTHACVYGWVWVWVWVCVAHSVIDVGFRGGWQWRCVSLPQLQPGAERHPSRSEDIPRSRMLPHLYAGGGVEYLYLYMGTWHILETL